jgi:hypothetical protein
MGPHRESDARQWALQAAFACGLVAITASVSAQEQSGRRTSRERQRAEQTQRKEGQAILRIADAAMAGKLVPSDFQIRWHNDFLKAQHGTFVPFTLTVDSSRLSPHALVYVRAVARTLTSSDGDGGIIRYVKEPRAPASRGEYAVDAIFPVDLSTEPGSAVRISRGFSLEPGEYDIYVVMRERLDSSSLQGKPKGAVLRQPISVPDFWSGELSTSTVILADRLTVLKEPITPDELAERPYVIGQNEITLAVDMNFRRDEELIVIFLVYNPTVSAEKKFDVEVEYHFFRRAANPGGPLEAIAAAPHPPELAGEKYFNHTEAQRFNPANMGAQFDPNAGHPLMAGQQIPLAGFEIGEYRLAIKVTDLLSGDSVVRDVSFMVGS